MRRPEPEKEPRESPTIFVPSAAAGESRRRRWPIFGLVVLGVTAVVAVAIMVAWPHFKPTQRAVAGRDEVERAASEYLKAIASNDTAKIKSLGTVEEPPAIRSVRSVTRVPAANRQVKGSFAPLGKLHTRIANEYDFDDVAGRFTPKNPMGAAAQTLDKLHEAKDEAEKSGLYKKMQSGDPDDIFDAAEQFGKVFTELAEGALSPKKIVPTYKMLVFESKPPLPEDAKALALEVAEAPADWTALLKRSFHTLKADGPFIFERAQVNATATDRLASSGDPPTRLKLTLVRFRLEGIDSGWKVMSIRRVLPGNESKPGAPSSSSVSSASENTSLAPGQPPRSLHDAPVPQ